jgi:hypothetical protein
MRDNIRESQPDREFGKSRRSALEKPGWFAPYLFVAPDLGPG